MNCPTCNLLMKKDVNGRVLIVCANQGCLAKQLRNYNSYIRISDLNFSKIEYSFPLFYNKKWYNIYGSNKLNMTSLYENRNMFDDICMIQTPYLPISENNIFSDTWKVFHKLKKLVIFS